MNTREVPYARGRREGRRAPFARFAVATARTAGRFRRRARAAWQIRSVHEHNERTIYLEAIFQALSQAGAMSFIAVFLVRLGAPSWLVGLYTSVSPLATLIAVLPMGAFVQRQRDLVKTLNWGRGLFRGIIGSFCLLPFLPAMFAPYVLVAARGIASIPGSILNVAGTTVMGQVTTPDRRPRMLSTRSAILGLFAAAIGFLAGQWLDAVPYPLNYQVLFASAFLAGLGSIWAMSRLQIPESIETVATRKRAGLRDMITLMRGTPAFRNFAVAAFVFRLGMSLPMGLFAIYRVRVLGSTDAWIGILLTVERLFGVFTYIALSRLLVRRKYRRWLWVATLGMVFFPVTTALATRPTMLLIPALMAGLFGPGMNIFLTNTLYQVSPEDQRPAFVAANSFLANLTGFVAPLVGTALAEITSIQLALFVGGALRFAGGLVFWRLGVNGEQQGESGAAD